MNEKKTYEIEMTESQKDKIQTVLDIFASDIAFGLEFKEVKEVKESENIKKEWPKQKDRYLFFSDSCGHIEYVTWVGNPSDKQRFALGNCFKSREEAEFELERLKVLAEMRKFEEPKDREWDGSVNHHWFIFYDLTLNAIAIDRLYCYKSSDIYFESQEVAEECIKAIGEDRIKKYYLGVMEVEE